LAKILKKYASDMLKISKYRVESLPDTHLISRDRTINVWIVNATSELHLGPYFGYLSVAETQKAAKFRFQKDKANFVLGRSILRILAGHYLSEDPKKVKFKYNKYGKPQLADSNILRFNIAHSEDSIVLGFSENMAIGIDVEKIKTDFDIMEIARNYFSEREIEALGNFPPSQRARAFYRCWTRKESFIKAKGTGLSFPLNAFTVSLNRDDSAKLLETQWQASERSEWNLYSFTPSEGYLAALTVYGKNKDIAYRHWDSSYL
jgi:4'-phosphopantetheinyl transferase